MNRNIVYFFLLLLTGITILVGFKQVQPKEKQEHMFIVIEGSSKKMRIHVSQEGGYEQEMIVAKNKFDFTHVLVLLNKYEKEGWQVQESNFTKSTAPDPGFTADHFNVLYFHLGR